MKMSFSRFLLAPLIVLTLGSVALAPVVEARAGGAGARAGAGAGGGGGRQVNNSNRDARAGNVRSTSANNVNSNRSRNTNVNANRNVNVNSSRNVDVDVDSDGCCGGGWDDDDHHPWAAAAAVAATAAIIGSTVNTVPANCVPVNVGGVVYQQCGSTWYQPQGSQYIVVSPPQ